MGKSGAGKTSMRSIIFANYLARDTMRLSPTMDVEHSHLRFFGNLTLNLWDCGGQGTFYEKYFNSQRENIFDNVELLIYVFDIESRNTVKDFEYFDSCVDAITEYSPSSRVFVLIHKMDLIPQDMRLRIFDERKQMIMRHTGNLQVKCFMTSIWDETLYKAWSTVVYSLIPNVNDLQKNLKTFGALIQACEVVLFEHSTFLEIGHCSNWDHFDVHRFEKISNIIKQFKLSCSKIQRQQGQSSGFGGGFTTMTLQKDGLTSIIQQFTTSTVIMVVLRTKDIIEPEVVQYNIRAAKEKFETFLGQKKD